MIKASEFCKRVFDGTHDTPKPVSNGYKLLTSKHIMNNYLDTDSAYCISEEDYNKINKRSQVRKWDVLFSMIGSVGTVYLVTEDKIDFAIKNMGVFSCEEEYRAKWLFFYLQSPYAQNIIRNYLNGAVQKFIPLGMLRDFPIPEIEKKDKKVVDLLWGINQKIINNDAICSELEEMAKTIYDYWFLQFEFPNEEGRPYKSSGGKMAWNEELEREIPVGWKVKKIGETFSSSRGISYNSKNLGEKGVPMINLASFKPGGGYKIEGIKKFTGNYDEDKCLKAYDLVMCNTQQTAIDYSKDIIGNAFLIPDIFESDIVSSHHVTTIKVKNENIKYYLCSLFNTKHFHRYIAGFTNGTNILGLLFNGVENYKSEIPDEKTLERYSIFCRDIEKRKSQIIKENHELTSLRDFLLPLLMNGQVSFEE